MELTARVDRSPSSVALLKIDTHHLINIFATAIIIHAPDTNGLSRSPIDIRGYGLPITAAERTIPRHPALLFSKKFGKYPRKYEAEHITRRIVTHNAWILKKAD